MRLLSPRQTSAIGWHQMMWANTSLWAQTVKIQHIEIDIEGWIDRETRLAPGHTAWHRLGPRLILSEWTFS